MSHPDTARANVIRSTKSADTRRFMKINGHPTLMYQHQPTDWQCLKLILTFVYNL